MVTAEARLRARTEAANEKRAKTIEQRQRLLREDVLLLRRRGLVPLAIADALQISLRRVVTILEEAGETIPSYLITSSPPARAEVCCPACGAALK